MRVYIGDYRGWFGIYQLCEKVLFWLPKKKGWPESLMSDEPDARFDFCDKYIADTWFGKTWNWAANKLTPARIEYVKVDRYDAWNADRTLALIIHPTLKAVAEGKQGSPFVDDEDVPEELRSTASKPLTDEEKETGHVDELHFKRWEWVLNEMVWAFGQKTIDWEDQFYSGEHDIFWKETNDAELDSKYGKKLFSMEKGPKDTFKIDREGMDKHYDRMKNGFRLFGKYYDNLWT